MASHRAHAPHRSARRSVGRTAALATLSIAGVLAAPQAAFAGEYGGGSSSSDDTGSSTTPPATTTPATPSTGDDQCDGAELRAKIASIDSQLADTTMPSDDAASLVSERAALVAQLAVCLDVDVDTVLSIDL